MIQTRFKMSSVFLVFLLIAVLFITAACANNTSKTDSTSNSSPEQYTIKVAYITAEGTPYDVGAKKFKEEVEAKANGRVSVELFPAGQLGNEMDILQAIQQGSVQAGIAAFTLTNFVPEASLFQTPFIFKDWDHALNVAKSDVAVELSDRIERTAGFKVLGYFTAGERNVISTKPIKSISDFKGVKLRVPESKLQVDVWKAVGANPTPLAWGEMYSGLQTGVIEAVELDPVNIVAQKLNEVAENYTQTRHLIGLFPFVIDINFFNTLPKDLQQVIIDAGAAATEEEVQFDKSEVKDAEKELIDSGVSIFEFDSRQLNDILQPVFEAYPKELPPELLKQIEEMK